LSAFLDIFGFLAVLLRALTLITGALTVGGIGFLLFVARGEGLAEGTRRKLLRLLTWSAIGLALIQATYLAANSAVLVGTSDLSWGDVAGAGYCIAGVSIVLGAVAIAIFAGTRMAPIVYAAGCGLILLGSVMTTHSMARLDNRFTAAVLTLTHQVGAAAWVGGMPYLLIGLKHTTDKDVARKITDRFSRLAMVSVGALLAAGFGLWILYVRSTSAMFGTTYGVMVFAKITITCAILALGALNLRIVRAARAGVTAELFPLRRFVEVEAGIGFTVILAAAALTSAPPSVDVRGDRVPPSEIAQRTKPQWPRMTTPPLNELTPPTPLPAAGDGRLDSFVPGGSVYKPPSPGDIAWSEYNHHWAGLIVLAIGVLALSATRFRWAKNWPIVFLALAVFLLIRADPENWPLGPHGFWESFQVAEVAQHRMFVLLIVLFAAFEWAVQTGRIDRSRAGLVFPLVCAVGGALLLTHSHSITNVKEEFLTELSHLPLAILGVVAGWSRWLEIRLPRERGAAFAWIWPVCFVLIGFILLNYREA
jgi:putative copper resistance protein D